ncbi:MAG: hypothetical protein K2X27_25955 [Candidatus Obscuribacterales bacterium]|nr:hypothetical protein [Candidatus Obscuribacterales bacterium]
MTWPTPQDYNEAIQNPATCFFDEELKVGSVELGAHGIPKSNTGSFASVYSVSCKEAHYAVRCLLHDMPDQQLRYKRLSEAICADSLEYTVDFEYQQQGIRVGDRAFPIVKMAWVSGDNLDEYLRKNHKKKKRMLALQKSFREMLVCLREEGFAHGDLQHGNILVNDDGLRLVDYDGMFVPALSSLQSNEIGHRNFQHPARSYKDFGPYLDNFSAWVIDTGLSCLIEDPELFGKLQIDGEAVLFRASDFSDPLNSKIFYELEKHESELISLSSRRLRTVLSCLPANIPFLSANVPPAEELPRILEERAALKILLEKEQERKKALEQMLRFAEEEARLQEHERLERVAAREASMKEAAMKKLEQERLAKIEHEKPSWLDESTADLLGNDDQENPSPSEGLLVSAADSGGSEKPESAGMQRPGASLPKPLTIEDCSCIFSEEATRRNQQISKELGDFQVEFDGTELRNYGSKSLLLHLTNMKDERALKIYCDDALFDENWMRGLEKTISELPDKCRQYFVETRFIEGAVLSKGRSVSALLSPWINSRSNLHSFLLVNKPDFDYTLLHNFRRMLRTLSLSKLAHGSLEPSNILILDELRLKLVDYDNLYPLRVVPIEDHVSPSYRHPLATGSFYGINIDNFQAWLLDTIILCWSAYRSIWSEFAAERGCLFFHPDDLKNPSGSLLFQRLISNQNYELSRRAVFLKKIIAMEPGKIPPLTDDASPPDI